MKLLLHVCCGPCSTACIEKLIKKFDITLFFSNSNIFPEEEYLKRKEELLKVASKYNLEVVDDEYTHSEWLEQIKGLENEKEGGKRCEKCFEFNFKKVLNYMSGKDFDYFTTTLTVSPYKDSLKIFKIGKYISKKFLEEDFKKKDGYKRSIELSKELNLYRQDYCGCEFSKNN